MRRLTAMLLRETLARENPGWPLRVTQRTIVRKESAYVYHYIARNLLPPLRYERRR